MAFNMQIQELISPAYAPGDTFERITQTAAVTSWLDASNTRSKSCKMVIQVDRGAPLVCAR